MDEADTYLKFAGRTAPFQWYAAANNHILNSALIRLFTQIFGLSELTLRMPALLGAALYIGAAMYLCAIVSERIILRLPLFLCLVYNPFVFDFLVAARGYGMACAFLLAAVAAAASVRLGRVSPAKGCVAVSVCVSLAFCSNFSFAFAALAILAAAVWWIARAAGFSRRLLLAALVPGALAVVILPLPVLLAWPHGQLYEGASSLKQAFGSVIHWSLYELNPEVANPLVFSMLRRVEHWLFPALAVVLAWRLAALWLFRNKLRATPDRWPAGLAAVLGGALLLATLAHWSAFHLFGLLLPYNRTALFYVPLTTLGIGALAAIRPEGRGAGGSRCALVAMLWLFAAHYLASMRLTYFGEWRYDGDVRKVYAALAPYNHDYCVDSLGANWMYSSALDFYRVLSGRESFGEVQPGLPMPLGESVYVLNANVDRVFIAQQKLSVVYRGASTDAVIAVRPEQLVRRDAQRQCLKASGTGKQ